MLDGPYPPRVIANKAGEGSRGVDIDNYPSVQRIGTQWSRVATPPTAAPSAVPVSGLQLSSPIPCGIPWNRKAEKMQKSIVKTTTAKPINRG